MSKKKKVTPLEKQRSPPADMLESYSPWQSVGKILPTSTKLKEDVFDSFRTSKKCLDYKISETWAKMQKGDLKVNVRETTAIYEEIPPEICKPRKRNRKPKFFSGGPPQWKFIDEKWRDKVEVHQEQIRKETLQAVRDGKRSRKQELRDGHERLQRVVGPEWFMELSPKQLVAVDNLRTNLHLDIKLGTVNNTRDILNSLGLIMPNRKAFKEDIAMAKKHSCGCAVEFLLVLYQLIDPDRKSYSLNDRLILSAVVHLTIVSTLRELHVRIPSPPYVEEEVKRTKKRIEKRKYSSPYLEPLVYEPRRPKFIGEYGNKHKQYPESIYFSYLDFIEEDKKCRKYCFNYSGTSSRVKEYKAAQTFFSSLPGAGMQNLISPTQPERCRNLLQPSEAPQQQKRFIMPHLCKVTVSEPEDCFCEWNSQRRNTQPRKSRRSCCERNAQKFLQSFCLCDDCLEQEAQKSAIRIIGGVQKAPCSCDDPVFLIQGTLLNKTCDCYKEYRDRVVGAMGRQCLVDNQYKFIIGGVTLTKIGPIYNIFGTLGEKVCTCGDTKRRNMQIAQGKEALYNSEPKYVIGGITMSKFGPVYNLTTVLGRIPCKCVLDYRKRLNILELQNEIRNNSCLFVNNGLVASKMGPVFHLSTVAATVAPKGPLELRSVCSCEIEKPDCFQSCMDHMEYKIHLSSDTSKRSSEESGSVTEETPSSVSTTTASTDKPACPFCAYHLKVGSKQAGKQSKPFQNQQHRPSCQKKTTLQDSSSLETETTSELSSSEPKTSKEETEKSSRPTSDYGDSLSPKPCRCKEELDKFMKAKCPCEECNRRIRLREATYVMGGTKETSSGNQINVVQGIQQNLCGCMKNHLEHIRRVEEYQNRVMARYKLKKQPKKYCISGVKSTPAGPVYIISGIRPPVDCECAKAARERAEQEEHERIRAKMPNTGRNKYEISGVKSMPDENVYILSRALDTEQCQCADILSKFERAHATCLKEFQRFLELTKTEIKELDNVEQAAGDKKTTESKEETVLKMEDLEDPITPPFTPADDEEETSSKTDQEIREKDNVQPPVRPSDKEREYDEASSSENESSSSDEECSSGTSSSESSTSSSDQSECGSCHVDIEAAVKPISLPSGPTMPESFLSKRFAIFREFPTDMQTLMEILVHILNGMADDGFPLAKLPHVYRLPIFKLWLQMRSGVCWDYDDRRKYFNRSKDMWRHTSKCYKRPRVDNLPFSKAQAEKMTWNDAKLIRTAVAENINKFYRTVKQLTVDAGREFFATTCSYEFPTPTWRDCAFAYLPTQENDVFAYKIVQPHDKVVLPENERLHCFC